MRQGIENNKETMPFKAQITVMFHGGLFGMSGIKSFPARGNAALTLSEYLRAAFQFVFSASSLLRHPEMTLNTSPSLRRTRSRPLNQFKTFSAEGPMARSALAVFVANPKKRSQHAAYSPITRMTEQRRCEVA